MQWECIKMASYIIATYLLALVVANLATSVINKPELRYEPTWDSLDSRPLPSWYDEAKVGIFIHWGVFSVPSFGSEWFWSLWKDQNEKKYIDYMKENYPEHFTYQEFAKDFSAEFFNATEWADLFKKSGAKYVVITSKHHEGFTLWPSKYSYSWNSVDVGPHRDIIGELSQAVRQKDLIFGTYHSLLEWNHPVYQADKASGFTSQEFVYNKIIPEMKELVENYKPDILWSDGDWETTSQYWESTEFLTWLYNESPVKDTVVTNDRWGTDTNCKHGSFLSCQDRFNPGTLQPAKWENAMTIDVASWGFRREAKLYDYYSPLDLISQIATTVSCGGELSEAVREKGLTFGVYHSLYEWFNPVYRSDKASHFSTKEFVYNKILPEMRELVENYKPEVLWSDGDWEASDTYWNSTEFLAWLYNNSPVKDTVVANDRWGIDIPCKHGDFYTCSDRYNPGTLQPHKWENAMTIDRESWGFRRNAKLSDYYTTAELISELASTVSCGGNLLMNVGPTKDGIISPIFEERLVQMGEWLSINGEAIYGTTPWTAQNDTLTWGVWYTSKGSTVYAIVLHWTWYDDPLPLAAPLKLFKDPGTTVTMLGNEDDGHLQWTASDAVYITFPDKSIVRSEWAWVLKIQPSTNLM